MCFLVFMGTRVAARLRGCQCCVQCDAPNIFRLVFGNLTVLCPVLADGDTCDPRTVVFSLRRPLLSGHFMSCLRKNWLPICFYSFLFSFSLSRPMYLAGLSALYLALLDLGCDPQCLNLFCGRLRYCSTRFALSTSGGAKEVFSACPSKPADGGFKTEMAFHSCVEKQKRSR